jgi:hypothetical protein
MLIPLGGSSRIQGNILLRENAWTKDFGEPNLPRQNYNQQLLRHTTEHRLDQISCETRTRKKNRKTQPPTCLHPPRSRGRPKPSPSKSQSTTRRSQRSTRTSSSTPAPSPSPSRNPPTKSPRLQTPCKSTARTAPSSRPKSPRPPPPVKKSAKSASHHTA